MHDAEPFKILTVCTGNVCRSPLAERSLQAGFDYIAPGSFEVRSAGTRALVGRSMTPEIEAIARSMAVNPSGFVSRQLAPEMLLGADLVLTLARGHSTVILEEHPLLLNRTFTLREFARILSQIPVDIGAEPVARWRTIARQAPRWRGVEYRGPEFDDVVDPYRRSAEVHQLAARQLVSAVRKIVEWELSATKRA